MKEIWRDICGYERFYQISNLGRVKRVEHTDKQGHVYKERFLSLRIDNRGYAKVHLSKDEKTKWFSVHRLVAEAFVPKRDGCDVVNHLDNNPSNNYATNLEWTTYKGNMQYAAKQGRMKYSPENLRKAQESKKIPVVAIKGDERIVFQSATDAAKSIGLASAGHIAAACRKEYGYKTVGGYQWEYADAELQKKQVPCKVGMTKEQMKEYLRNRMTGNNIMVGKKLSEATKRKLSEATGKPICQFALDGTFIAEYCSSNDAKKVTGISHTASCASGKRKTAGGFSLDVEGGHRMNNIFTKEWWSASLIRSMRTIAQTAIATIGTSAVMSEVNWQMVLSASVLAGILSILTSLAGLPEVKNE